MRMISNRRRISFLILTTMLAMILLPWAPMAQAEEGPQQEGFFQAFFQRFLSFLGWGSVGDEPTLKDGWEGNLDAGGGVIAPQGSEPEGIPQTTSGNDDGGEYGGQFDPDGGG